MYNRSIYIKKMNLTYKQLYGEFSPPTPQFLLLENDHPKLEKTRWRSNSTVYQRSLIGSIQWFIVIGRWDAQTSVMSLSSFWDQQLQKRHIRRVKQIYRNSELWGTWEMSHFNNKKDKLCLVKDSVWRSFQRTSKWCTKTTGQEIYPYPLF